MSKAIIKSGLILLVVLLALVPIIGCVPEEVPPPEKKVIKVGILSDLTGPYSTVGVPIFDGYFDYYRHINETEGGINGIPVKATWGDCKADPAISISLYRRFRAEGIVCLSTTTSSETTALSAILGRDKMPCTSTAGASNIYFPPRNVFSTYIVSAFIMATGLDWYYGEWQKKGLDRPMRVALLTWDNPYGRDGRGGAERWIERHKPAVEIVTDLFTSPMTMDYTSELTIIKGDNPDLVVCTVS